MEHVYYTKKSGSVQEETRIISESTILVWQKNLFKYYGFQNHALLKHAWPVL